MDTPKAPDDKVDVSHLHALRMRRSCESVRLSQAKTPSACEFYKRVVAQIDQEIAGELKFLGHPQDVACEIDEDKLLADLLG